MNPFAALQDDLRRLRMEVGLDGDLNAIWEGDTPKQKLVDPTTGEPFDKETGEPAKGSARGSSPGAGRAPRRGEAEKKGVEFLDDVFRKLGKQSDIDHEAESGNYPGIGPGTFVTLWDREQDLLLSAFVSDDDDQVVLYGMKVEKTEDEMKKEQALDISDANYDRAVDAAVAFARKLA